MSEQQKRAFVVGARWAVYGKYECYTPEGFERIIKEEANRRYTPKPTCEDCHFQFDNPFDESFCQKGFKATRVCKQFKKRGSK